MCWLQSVWIKFFFLKFFKHKRGKILLLQTCRFMHVSFVNQQIFAYTCKAIRRIGFTSSEIKQSVSDKLTQMQLVKYWLSVPSPAPSKRIYPIITLLYDLPINLEYDTALNISSLHVESLQQTTLSYANCNSKVFVWLIEIWSKFFPSSLIFMLSSVSKSF